MTQGADLHRLQYLDSECDAKQSRLAEIKAELGESQALKQARRALEVTQKLVRKWTLRQRDLELEAQGISDKTARSEQRLYSGTVKNPKELADLQSEIASLRRRQQKLEDDLLEIMIEREEAEAAYTQAQQHLDETETHWSLQQANLVIEQETLQKNLSETEQTRAELLPSIDAGDLSTYQHLRRRKGGLAVTQVNGDACGACGMAISPNLKWQLRQEGLAHCSNCERIIVYI
jgi:predicted  nucleic acid-binding Zn-ribbon protein